MVFEYCNRTLEEYLTSTKLNFVQKMKLARDLALGIEWMHDVASFIHGELSSQTVFVTDHGIPKVGGYGFSIFEGHVPLESKNPKYVAPELYSNPNLHHFQSDVFSFGTLLWEISTQQVAFADMTSKEAIKTAIQKGDHPPIHSQTNPNLAKLLSRCWDLNPQNRPTFREIAFRLGEILVNFQIHDKDTRDFWLKNFFESSQSLDDVVPFYAFAKTLQEITEIHARKWAVIRDIFVNEGMNSSTASHPNASNVTMRWVDRIVHTWGKFFVPSKAEAFLEFTKQFVNEPWYHGEISRSIAEERLRGKEQGTFLIRTRDPFGESEPGAPFAISSLATPTMAIHRVIYYDPLEESPMFKVTNEHHVTLKCETIKELISSPVLALKQPCDRVILPHKYGDSSPTESE